MWDGIENAGWGVHDPEATVWKDLIGTDNWNITEHGSWTENALASDGNGIAAVDAIANSFMTAEACFKSLIPKKNSLSVFVNLGKTGFNGAVYFAQISKTKFGFGRTTTFAADTSLPTTLAFANTSLTNIKIANGWRNGVEIPGYSNGSFFTSTAATSLGGAILTNGNTDWMCAAHIYSIRLYSRALTTDEIAANYAVDKARFNLPYPLTTNP